MIVNKSALRATLEKAKILALVLKKDFVFILNDYPDIAIEVGADGVHVGQDTNTLYTREIVGSKFIIGKSTHNLEQGFAAEKEGVDYISVGPVFETPTKPGRKSVGLEYVEWASENVNIPWFAIGGINTENVSEVINAGASRIAVVRAIINAEKPYVSAKTFAETLNLKKLSSI